MIRWGSVPWLRLIDDVIFLTNAPRIHLSVDLRIDLFPSCYHHFHLNHRMISNAPAKKNDIYTSYVMGYNTTKKYKQLIRLGCVVPLSHF